MTKRQLVRDILDHKEKNKIGFQFYSLRELSHIRNASGGRLKKPEHIPAEYLDWTTAPELFEKFGEPFNGELRYDMYGNIYGRLNGQTKGECVKGAIEDWDMLADYEIPELDMTFLEQEIKNDYKNSDQYIMAGSCYSVFSNFRDCRLMTNALMDTVTDPEMVIEFVNKIVERELQLVDALASVGVDGMMMCDDWGTQDRTFISPASFREIFKPAYKAIADRLHSHNMHFILHSCGYNVAYMEDFIEAGIDAMQFDQLSIYGYEETAEKYADRISFFCPLDIQKTLPTGDKEFIVADAKRMLDAFKGKGGLLLKDYPGYGDIGVEEEWAQLARETFMSYGDWQV